MNYFLLLVQEREAKMLAPVWEVAARAAAAAPPPLPPRPSAVLLHEKFDCELSCLSPNELSAVSYNLTCSHIVQSLALQISATLLATTGENLSSAISLYPEGPKQSHASQRRQPSINEGELRFFFECFSSRIIKANI